MPRTKAQYEEIRSQKRQLIKQIALKLFAEKGYSATSIGEIAKASKISKGLIYNYFESKEQVMQAIWDDLIAIFYDTLEPHKNREMTHQEAEAFIDKTFEILITRREEMKLYYQCSFQPEVLNFLEHKYNTEDWSHYQQSVIHYFLDKLPIENKKYAFFSVLVFIKGFSMVVTYSEHIFTDIFLIEYKDFLKKTLLTKDTQS